MRSNAAILNCWLLWESNVCCPLPDLLLNLFLCGQCGQQGWYRCSYWRFVSYWLVLWYFWLFIKLINKEAQTGVVMLYSNRAGYSEWIMGIIVLQEITIVIISRTSASKNQCNFLKFHTAFVSKIFVTYLQIYSRNIFLRPRYSTQPSVGSNLISVSEKSLLCIAIFCSRVLTYLINQCRFFDLRFCIMCTFSSIFQRVLNILISSLELWSSEQNKWLHTLCLQLSDTFRLSIYLHIKQL